MPENPSQNALHVADITYRYCQRIALDDVGFSVGKGETVMLIGPNGAGKTTLFSLICGLFSPQAGSIRIMDQDVTAGALALAPLGIVFQQPALDLDLTVGQNLRYFCALHGLDRSTANTRIAYELAQMEMADRLNDKVRSLNGGHRRRVEIARANLHRPNLLLLDEPTVGLDIPTRNALVADLRSRSSQKKISILWATHLIDEVEGADRVIVLHNGRIVADGAPDELLARTGADTLDRAFTVLTSNEETA
jgi:ABC-2 type transport system ATP-binding protein